MQDTKSLLPAGQCRNIREFYRSAQAQLARLNEARRTAGQLVDDLQNRYLLETDIAEKRRLRIMAAEALREFQHVDQDFQRRSPVLQERLKEYSNDYEITRCRDLLGPL